MLENDDHGQPGEMGEGAKVFAELGKPHEEEHQETDMSSTAPENRETGEVLAPSHFEVAIDRQKLASAEGLPDNMRDWLTRLPESLNFSEPVTLVVGENGEGKTSFARAIIEGVARSRNGAEGAGSLRLEHGEPAESILPALSITAPASEGRKTGVTFLEGAEIMYKSREWSKQQAQSGDETERATLLSEPDDFGFEDRDPKPTTGRLSSRQLFEQSLELIKQMRIDDNRWQRPDAAVIFDEPEQGLSPQRQMELPETVQSFLPKSDVLLVPTNNLALYLSDLPRLDLSQPERGIFRPSEYGEGGKIELAQQQAT